MRSEEGCVSFVLGDADFWKGAEVLRYIILSLRISKEYFSKDILIEETAVFNEKKHNPG